MSTIHPQDGNRQELNYKCTLGIKISAERDSILEVSGKYGQGKVIRHFHMGRRY